MNDVNETDRIVQALERRPQIDVPPDFSQRVIARLPTPRRKRDRHAFALGPTFRYGPALMLCAIALLLVGVLLLAGFSQGSGSWFAAQLLLLLDLFALTLYTVWSQSRA